jgi:multidrug efflux pump subunit AcrA (membrane-fusion protein)
MDVHLQRKPRAWSPYYAAAGLFVLGIAITGVTRLRDAAPKVARSSVWIDSVRRGDLLREVSGPGRIAPQAVRLISARSAGTVERILLEPGADVAEDSVILELDNPDLELAALEAAGDVKHAEAELLDLQASLQIQMIEQRASAENVAMQLHDAERKARVQEQLAEKDMAAPITLAEARERADELRARLDFEHEHISVLESASHARLAAKRAELERLRAQAALRQDQVDALKVRAGSSGVLQELPLDVGQQVALGMQLAKVADPKRLKAELRIPEARAKELAPGQAANIEIQHDTVRGRVTHVDPAVQDGSVLVDVAFEGSLPMGAKPDLSVAGRIELERVRDVLYTGKPASSGTDQTIGLFRLLAGGKSAERVAVRLGKTSVSAVEVVSGLREGDRVILSDMSEWDRTGRIELE